MKRQAFSLVRPNGLGAKNLFGDLTGGLTAAVVALPLALAFGVASGAGPAAGLIGAAVLGFFAALFGGTPSQISGPTGPMTVVMVGIAAAYPGDLGFLALVIVLAGVLQALFGFLKLGQYITYMPSSVISGFMTGIGLVVIKLQLPIVLAGVLAVWGGGADDHPYSDLLIACLALACHFLLPQKLARVVPAPLFALIACIAAAQVLPGAGFLGAVSPAEIDLVTPTIGLDVFWRALPFAAFLAFLGSIDSLLTSLVADNLTATQHNSEKELVGQGIGNILAGLAGGVPGAGATMRTVVNIKSGGHSARSGMFHALLLVAVIFGLGPFVAYVPEACLAGILLKVGWDIIDWSYLKNLHKIPREKAFIVILVSVLTVVTDLMTAVLAGLIVASLVSAKWLRDVQLQQVKISEGAQDIAGLLPVDASDTGVLHIRFTGPFSYSSARALLNVLTPSKADIETVILDFTGITYIELSNALAIKEAISTLTRKGIIVYALDPQTDATRILTNVDVFEALPASQYKAAK